MAQKYKTNFISEYSSLMNEWDFEKNYEIDPNKISIGSNKKVGWICSVCGHHWNASINNRFRLGSGCPGCANREVVLGKNDLATRRPELVKEWHPTKNEGLTPQDVTTNSSKLIWWKCSTCGYEWQKKVKDKLGCPSCTGKVLISGKNDLASQFPEIAKDWNYEKNIDLTPDHIRQSSHSNVWWKCSTCGYEWIASVNNRTNHSSGCPVCTKNSGAIPGKTDLCSTHPDLMKEWNYEKNKLLNPENYTSLSHKKAWWKCSTCGYEWETSIDTRSKGGNCPRCYHTSQTSFPEQAFYFYIKKLFPDTISRYKADFLGRMELDIFIPSIRLGIEYDGSRWHTEDKVNQERKKYYLCKKNNIKLIRIKEKFFPMANVIEDIADEQFQIVLKDGKSDLESSITFFLQRFTTRYIFNDTFSVDLNRDGNEIRNLFQGKIENSLTDKFPEIAKEWHPTKNESLKPDFFHYGSEFQAWWLCPKCGFEYQTSIKHRTRKRANGCPVCSHQRLVVGMNDLATTHPHLAAEWHPTKNGDITPQNVVSGSKNKFWWKCSKCGYDWEATISHRKHSNSGCPICYNRKIIPGLNDFATSYPDLVKEWHPTKNGEYTPQNVSPRSNKRIWWKCSICGEEWSAVVASRTQKGTLGCIHCKRKAIEAEKRKKKWEEKGQQELSFD